VCPHGRDVSQPSAAIAGSECRPQGADRDQQAQSGLIRALDQREPGATRAIGDCDVLHAQCTTPAARPGRDAGASLATSAREHEPMTKRPGQEERPEQLHDNAVLPTSRTR